MSESLDKSSVPLLPWWQEWDGRLEAELERFAERDLPVTLIEDPRQGADRLVLESSAPLPDDVGDTRVRVVYPDGFPHRKFAVYAPDIELARHQAPGGNLCVFPRDARYWHPNCLAADTVADDVPRLIRLVQAGGAELRDAEDPQGEPFTTYYQAINLGGIVVDERVDALKPTDGMGGFMHIAFDGQRADWLGGVPDLIPDGWRATIGQGLLLTLKDNHGDDLLSAPHEGLRAGFGAGVEGRWTYLPEPPRVESPERLWDAAIASDANLARWVRNTNGTLLVGLCTRDEVQQDVYENAWVFLSRVITKDRARGRNARSGSPSKRAASTRIEGPPTIIRALRWTPEDLSVRIPELSPLRSATVAVVGLGSLGAPFVQELVKARVAQVRVTDFDHVDPGTSVRHPLGLADAGVDKGLALVRWAQRHNPEVDVQPWGLMIGATPPDRPGRSERESLHEILNGVDLLVSATAEPDVNRQLDGAATAMRLPRLYLWSQSGYGGIVALLEPGKTGCFHCLSLFLSKRSDEGDDVIKVPDDIDGQPVGTIQGRGCADKTFTANHPDLLPLSIQAARVAFGHLCGDSGGYPKFADNVFAVQMREPDGQPIPPRWTSYALPPDPECPLCSND